MYARALDFAGSRDSERQELLVSVERGGVGTKRRGVRTTEAG